MNNHPLRRARSLSRALALAFALALAPGAADASLIAAWDWAGNADDVSGNAPAYDLGAIGSGADLSGGFARFDGGPNYLQTGGPGGTPDFTVSLWVRSQGVLDQGGYQGILSNNFSAGDDYSWQIESHNGAYRWRNFESNNLIGAPTALGQWDHIVIRKFGGNQGDIWLNGVEVATVNGNPGGLQSFRFGTNRNTDSFWQGDIGEVRIFDSLEDAGNLFLTTSPGAAVPEPSLGILVLASALTLRRRP